MKALKKLQLVVITLFVSNLLSAQNIVVTGKVTGIDGPLHKAKVELANHNTQTTTNANGVFTIEVPEANSSLIISYKKAKKTVVLENGKINSKLELIPIEKHLYKEVLSREELRLCDIYIKHYGSGKHIQKVKQIREKQFFIEAYNIAASQFSDTALRNYMRQYPNGIYTDKVKDAIEIACWQKACNINTADAYKSYLNNYPNGKAAEIAKNKMANLK